MYCGMISAMVDGIIPISPYTTVDDKALTAKNLKVRHFCNVLIFLNLYVIKKK